MGQTYHLRVGKTGVSEMGVGETGVGETGIPLLNSLKLHGRVSMMLLLQSFSERNALTKIIQLSIIACSLFLSN